MCRHLYTDIAIMPGFIHVPVDAFFPLWVAKDEAIAIGVFTHPLLGRGVGEVTETERSLADIDGCAQLVFGVTWTSRISIDDLLGVVFLNSCCRWFPVSGRSDRQTG